MNILQYAEFEESGEKARKNLFFIKYQQKTSKLDLNSLSQATKDFAWDGVLYF